MTYFSQLVLDAERNGHKMKWNGKRRSYYYDWDYCQTCYAQIYEGTGAALHIQCVSTLEHQDMKGKRIV